jgi:tryptophanyl-tRNA synthetase
MSSTEPAIAQGAPSLTSSARKPRVFSGIQPTGDLHLGTYLGALRQWVERQDERDNVFCVVDLHALTIPENVDPKRLKDDVRRVAALYLAVGLDPDSNTIFAQSHLHEHAELTWLLNCATPLGWLYRMTQFKTKAEGRDSVGTGLLDYPVLQAADILLYDTEMVPVGEDQRQHIELTRDIAVRFNNLFGEVFVLPQAVVPTVGARIMGLDDPEVKMSKSIGAQRAGHAVNLLDDERVIRKAIISAVTDSGREVRYEHASAGVRNLLSILQTLDGRPMEALEQAFEGKGYGDLKKAVAGAVLDTLTPIRQAFEAIMAEPGRIDELLAHGAERARAIAAPTLVRVKEAMGVG